MEGSWLLDFTPLFPAILAAMQAGVSAATLARRFHATVAQASVKACGLVARDSGLERVVLSGGVFQNRLLTEMVYTDLTKSGLQVFTHRLTPPNDGCIALGQAAVAGWQTRRKN
jgi:hydrogenase maturation protein HypF